ncbi:hypothetical protein [Shinella sp.]|uniref:hypothetical protein n=1 Tax=Shinella sp. TaxID=1870904 RepID=UPI00301DF1EB
MVRSETKAAVLSAMADIGRQALADGKDAYAAIERAMPDAPVAVVVEAWLAVEDEATTAWWDQVEKTIDGEIVRRAIGINGPEEA